MKTIIQDTPAYQLVLDLEQTNYGVNVRFISFVPTARRPEEQVKLQLVLSLEELDQIQKAIQKVLAQAVASATI